MQQMFSALKHINCDLKMQFLCNLTAIICKLNLRTKSPKFICKFTTIFYSVIDCIDNNQLLQLPP